MFKIYDITGKKQTRFFKIMNETNQFVTVKEIIKNDEGHMELVGKSIRRKEFKFGIEIEKNVWAIRV